MSIEADDINGETAKKDLLEEQINWLKVIAFALCEMQELDVWQIYNDMRNSK